MTSSLVKRKERKKFDGRAVKGGGPLLYEIWVAIIEHFWCIAYMLELSIFNRREAYGFIARNVRLAFKQGWDGWHCCH